MVKRCFPKPTELHKLQCHVLCARGKAGGVPKDGDLHEEVLSIGFRDNGKENGNYTNYFRDYIGLLFVDGHPLLAQGALAVFQHAELDRLPLTLTHINKIAEYKQRASTSHAGTAACNVLLRSAEDACQHLSGGAVWYCLPQKSQESLCWRRQARNAVPQRCRGALLRMVSLGNMQRRDSFPLSPDA